MFDSFYIFYIFTFVYFYNFYILLRLFTFYILQHFSGILYQELLTNIYKAPIFIKREYNQSCSSY